MNSRPFLRFLCILLLAVPVSACSGREKVKFEKKDLVFLSGAGEISVSTEIARSDGQRSRGLMYREELKDGEGMLFIFERDQILSFWMKDTLIPLSIAFISSGGRILEIRDMRPGDLSSVVSGRSARYAMEVPQGWFGRAGIDIGDRLVTDNL